MLLKVKTKSQKIEKYKDLISPSLFDKIIKKSKKLEGLKVIHINSTPRGGGVAEVLKGLVPLMRGVGINAFWHTIPQSEEFFEITKKIHNALQGEKFDFSNSLKKSYLDHIEETSRLLEKMKADVWILHDPQPIGLIDYMDTEKDSTICRIHVDSSNPDKSVWDFLNNFLTKFDKVIFSAKDFSGKGIKKDKIAIFPPAIDPISEKNIVLPTLEAKNILENFGINPKKPLIAQISRFDKFKDPLGVIEAYKIAKKKIPNLQLILAGLFLAHDDPEAVKVFKEVEKASVGDSDIFLFSNPDRLGSLRVDSFVSACQTASDVILQKSIKEGFGLTVSEAMWKEKPVIGGNVGGIKLQIKDGENGFLVSSPKKAGKRLIQLFEDKKLRIRMGKSAKRTVKEKFLMPRLLDDYLELFSEFLD